MLSAACAASESVSGAAGNAAVCVGDASAAQTHIGRRAVAVQDVVLWLESNCFGEELHGIVVLTAGKGAVAFRLNE